MASRRGHVLSAARPGRPRVCRVGVGYGRTWGLSGQGSFCGIIRCRASRSRLLAIAAMTGWPHGASKWERMGTASALEGGLTSSWPRGPVVRQAPCSPSNGHSLDARDRHAWPRQARSRCLDSQDSPAGLLPAPAKTARSRCLDSQDSPAGLLPALARRNGIPRPPTRPPSNAGDRFFA